MIAQTLANIPPFLLFGLILTTLTAAYHFGKK